LVIGEIFAEGSIGAGGDRRVSKVKRARIFGIRCSGVEVVDP